MVLACDSGSFSSPEVGEQNDELLKNQNKRRKKIRRMAERLEGGCWENEAKRKRVKDGCRRILSFDAAEEAHGRAHK